jgi:hypothetical protein
VLCCTHAPWGQVSLSYIVLHARRAGARRLPRALRCTHAPCRQVTPTLAHGGLQVVITDNKGHGMYLDVWRRVSHPHPVRLWPQDPFPNGTCFRYAVQLPMVRHEQSLLSKGGHREARNCASPVVQGASLWLKYLFSELNPGASIPGPCSSIGRRLLVDNVSAAGAPLAPPPSFLHQGQQQGALAEAAAAFGGALDGCGGGSATQHADTRTLKVVWLSRHHFEQRKGKDLIRWQRVRKVRNGLEVALALQQAVQRWNSAAAKRPRAGCSVMFQFQARPPPAPSLGRHLSTRCMSARLPHHSLFLNAAQMCGSCSARRFAAALLSFGCTVHEISSPSSIYRLHLPVFIDCTKDSARRMWCLNEAHPRGVNNLRGIRDSWQLTYGVHTSVLRIAPCSFDEYVVYVAQQSGGCCCVAGQPSCPTGRVGGLGDVASASPVISRRSRSGCRPTPCVERWRR